MMQHVDMAIQDADVVMYIIEITSRESQLETDIKNLKRINLASKPVVLIINKVDLISKSHLLPVIEQYSNYYPFESIIPISAKKQDGLSELIDLFYKFIPLHPPFYDQEVLTDQPERFFVAELIREQVFFQFQKEIPYSIEVAVTEFKERKKSKDYICTEIYVERDSQKAIVIGKNGEALKKLSLNSRKEIEKFLEKDIYLEIIVKVKKNWRQDERILKQFGY